MTASCAAGASLASTPAQSGQRVMPRSKTSDLIAPSLANLPNALDADYWLKKVQIQEQLGMYKVTKVLLALPSLVQHYFSLVWIHLVCFLSPQMCKLQAAVDLFELAVKRDVRPATTISRSGCKLDSTVTLCAVCTKTVCLCLQGIRRIFDATQSARTYRHDMRFCLCWHLSTTLSLFTLEQCTHHLFVSAGTTNATVPPSATRRTQGKIHFAVGSEHLRRYTRQDSF